MNITIKTIPHDQQRYETVGDWIVKGDNIKINVSKLSKPEYEFLIGIHEAIEAFMYLRDGGTLKAIDDFDTKYEEDRGRGKYTLEQEPGDDPDAPYNSQHFLATTVERLLAQAMGVDWQKYNQEVMSL